MADRAKAIYLHQVSGCHLVHEDLSISKHRKSKLAPPSGVGTSNFYSWAWDVLGPGCETSCVLGMGHPGSWVLGMGHPGSWAWDILGPGCETSWPLSLGWSVSITLLELLLMDGSRGNSWLHCHVAVSYSNLFPSVHVCAYICIHICVHGQIHRNVYKYVYIYVSLLLCFSLEPYLLREYPRSFSKCPQLCVDRVLPFDLK